MPSGTRDAPPTARAARSPRTSVFGPQGPDVQELEFQMTLRRVTTLLALSMAFVVAGCATKPATQWWRVGNCLVLYEQNSREKQLVAVGQGCDIKRETITAAGEVN